MIINRFKFILFVLLNFEFVFAVKGKFLDGFIDKPVYVNVYHSTCQSFSKKNATTTFIDANPYLNQYIKPYQSELVTIQETDTQIFTTDIPTASKKVKFFTFKYCVQLDAKHYILHLNDGGKNYYVLVTDNRFKVVDVDDSEDSFFSENGDFIKMILKKNHQEEKPYKEDPSTVTSLASSKEHKDKTLSDHKLKSAPIKLSYESCSDFGAQENLLKIFLKKYANVPEIITQGMNVTVWEGNNRIFTIDGYIPDGYTLMHYNKSYELIYCLQLSKDDYIISFYDNILNKYNYAMVSKGYLNISEFFSDEILFFSNNYKKINTIILEQNPRAERAIKLNDSYFQSSTASAIDEDLPPPVSPIYIHKGLSHQGLSSQERVRGSGHERSLHQSRDLNEQMTAKNKFLLEYTLKNKIINIDFVDCSKFKSEKTALEEFLKNNQNVTLAIKPEMNIEAWIGSKNNYFNMVLYVPDGPSELKYIKRYQLIYCLQLNKNEYIMKFFDDIKNQNYYALVSNSKFNYTTVDDNEISFLKTNLANIIPSP